MWKINTFLLLYADNPNNVDPHVYIHMVKPDLIDYRMYHGFL